jgi:glycosyltransferase involved in cell wall biosynthesis
VRVVLLADYAIAEGGAPQVAIASALGLAAQGVEVTYIHGVGEADPALHAAGVRCIGLDGRDIWSKSLPQAARDGIWNKEHLARLSRILGDFDARNSLVHVHQWTKFFSPSVFSAVRQSGLPLVVSMHDYFLSCPTGLFYRFDRHEPCTLKPMSIGCIASGCDPRSRAHKLIRVLRTGAVARALGNTPLTAIHVSERGRRQMQAFLPASVRQVVLQNPVETTDEGPRVFRGQRKVVYCGRLTEEKGALLVAEAARAAGLPSLFIGDGPLRARILAIDPDAEITGWLDKAEVRKRLSSEALALVAPSLWPETGPLVVAEAMALGIPVIVSERAGAADRVVEGVNGFSVEPAAKPIAQALGRLAQPDVAATMGQAAYATYWEKPPTPDIHARGLIDIYRSALSPT